MRASGACYEAANSARSQRGGLWSSQFDQRLRPAQDRLRDPSADGIELQWSESLSPLMRHISEKKDVTIRRCKDGVTVWPTQTPGDQSK